MPLPAFNDMGQLPPGIYAATLDEITERFGYTSVRQRLLIGLMHVLTLLTEVGCQRAWLDGSFITASERMVGLDPADFDLCWDIAGVDLIDLARRDHAFDPLRPDRQALHQRYGGDLFFVTAPFGVGLMDYFQHDRDGRRKGIVLIDLLAKGVHDDPE